MKALIPILYVLIVDIIFASMVYGMKTSGKNLSEDNTNKIIIKLVVYVSFHLTLMLAVYCFSKITFIEWYDDLVQGKEGSIVFYLLNFIVYTTAIFLYDLTHPDADYKIASKTTLGIFIGCMFLSLLVSILKPYLNKDKNVVAAEEMVLEPEQTDSIPVYGCIRIISDGEAEMQKGRNGAPFTMTPGGNTNLGECGQYMLYVTNHGSSPMTVTVEPMLNCKRYQFARR